MLGHEPGRSWLTRPFDTFYEDPFQSITIIGCYSRSHIELLWQGAGDLKVKSRIHSCDVSNSVYLKRILFLLLSFVQWLHVGARNPGTRYIMNTKTDTEAPSARTQWIAEPLHHCEKYFNILPKFLVIFHPCHYSCRS